MKFPGNIGDLLQQAQKLQENAALFQVEMEKKIVEGSAGGGMVLVTANCTMQILSLKIDPGLISANDPAMLQDLAAAAVNDALSKAKKLLKEEIIKMTGFPIPGIV